MLNASKQFKPQLKPRSLTFLPLEPLLVFSEDYFVLLDAGLVACWPLAAALNLTKTFGIHVQIVILILQFINHWHLRFNIDRIWPIFKVNILLIFDHKKFLLQTFPQLQLSYRRLESVLILYSWNEVALFTGTVPLTETWPTQGIYSAQSAVPSE